MKKVSKKNYISEYILPFVGPLLGIMLTTLILIPFTIDMTVTTYFITVGEIYLGVIGFVIVVFLLTAFTMLLMKIPVISNLLFSKASKKLA